MATIDTDTDARADRFIHVMLCLRNTFAITAPGTSVETLYLTSLFDLLAEEAAAVAPHETMPLISANDRGEP